MKKNISDILSSWKSDSNSITNDEKKLLIKYAKDAYYNTGLELMSDIEYDKLEKEVGLDNKTNIGAEPDTTDTTYVIPHPYIMGSLSKVQIKEDKDGNIDWNKYLIDIRHFIKCAGPLVITPKYDGCSYEIVIESKFGYPFEITSISTRGNGNYGKDIKPIIENVLDKTFIDNVINYFKSCYAHAEYEEVNKIVLRGEVLVNKDVFKKKYVNEFVNTRAFVSGILNRQYTPDSKEYMDMVKDLSLVCYEVKYHLHIADIWHELEWKYLESCDVNKNVLPQFYKFATFIRNYKDFECLYHEFENYRNNVCPFSLDGIVIKPLNRENNLTKPRPIDCVAIKFVPQLQETTVTNIEWNIGKTGEYIPTIVTEPVIMDGKKVSRACAFHYSNLIEKKLSIGCKVVLSLAGDIIPFIYKVTDTSKFDLGNLNLPNNVYIESGRCIAIMNAEEVALRHLVNSMVALGVPGLGPSSAKVVAEYVKKNCEGDEFFGTKKKEIPFHALEISDVDYGNAIGGKNGEKVEKGIVKLKKTITLDKIISTCLFNQCGGAISTQIANMMLDLPYSFESMNHDAYKWAIDKDSDEYNKLIKVLQSLGKSINDFKNTSIENVSKSSNQIPIIMTGEPNNYSSKAEFLSCHPEYRNTTSWKEVKIVFTNSMDSNTGKMKKAREKNIEIRIY